MSELQESIVSKNLKYWGIPLVGFLMSLIINENYDLFTVEHLIHGLISTFVTGLYWLACWKIVTYLWKKYPWHIQPLKHLLIEIGLILLVVIIITSSSSLLMLVLPELAPVNFSEIKYQSAIIILLSFFLTSLHEAIFFYLQWQEHFKKSAILEKSNVIAKYETLKSQVNPHFLFNSLNTLITYVDDNKKASDYIENLSDFLRYTLNNQDLEIRKLEDEIDIVEKYFFLQKSRFGENISLKIDIDDDLLALSLPPLSLQMLVENAIKHNIISKEKKLTISITSINNYIIVENNLQKKIDADSTKKGLENIIKRYEFLSSDKVKITESQSTFKVEIPLLKF